MADGLTVPNRGDVVAPELAQLDAAHFRVALAGLLGTGVVYNPTTPVGCAATANGTNFDIAISAGKCVRGTNQITVPAGSVTVGAAHASLGRCDLIVVDDAGTLTVVAGTAAAAPAYPEPPSDKVTLWGVLVQASATALAQNKLQDLRAIVPGEYRYDGELISRLNIPSLTIWGHSLAKGGGTSDFSGFTDRDAVGHLVGMLPAIEDDHSQGGAILGHHQSNGAAGGTGDGGWGKIAQEEIRDVRKNTTLTAQANSGQKVLTVASTAGMVFGMALHVGNGDTGASGGEWGWIFTVDSATQVTLVSNLARTHANGQPVFEIPTAYVKPKSVVLFWFGLNDLAYGPISSATAALQARFTDAWRTSIARIRSAEIFDDDHSMHVYTGSWTQFTSRSANSGSTLHTANALNVSVESIVPDNFRGGTATWVGVALPGAGTDPVWTFTVDGVAAGTLTVYDSPTGKDKTYCKRFTGLSPGRHKIVAQLTTLGSRSVYFDYLAIAAEEPPLIIVPSFNRPYAYDLWASAVTWPNKRNTTTLTGTHGVGTTSWTVASTTNMLIGQTFTLEEGVGNQEVLEVQSVTDATHCVTTTASTLSHAGGVGIVYGIQDADIAKMNTILQNLCAEFDERVAYVDIDTVLNKNVAYFYYDTTHFNDLGHVVVVQTLWEAIQRSIGLTPKMLSFTAQPSGPPPVFVPIVGGSSSTWTNLPSAETELLGAAIHRHKIDARRFRDINFQTNVLTAGTAGSKLALQYSLDSGTTWTYMGRDAVYSTTSTTSRDQVSVGLNSTGFKESTWQRIPGEARMETLFVRAIGYGGDGVADPAVGLTGFWVR